MDGPAQLTRPPARTQNKTRTHILAQLQYKPLTVRVCATPIAFSYTTRHARLSVRLFYTIIPLLTPQPPTSSHPHTIHHPPAEMSEMYKSLLVRTRVVCGFFSFFLALAFLCVLHYIAHTRKACACERARAAVHIDFIFKMFRNITIYRPLSNPFSARGARTRSKSQASASAEPSPSPPHILWARVYMYATRVCV